MAPRKISYSNNFNESQTQPPQENPDTYVMPLLEQALELEVPAETKQPKIVSKKEFEATVDAVAREFGTTPVLALSGMFACLQAGGSSNNKRSNVKITIGEVVFESKRVNTCIVKNCKGFTPRQFAKCFANQIFAVAKKLDIMGNAYISLTRFYSSQMTESIADEKFWCADFQIDNAQCPEYIREALRRRYTDKFRRGLAK